LYFIFLQPLHRPEIREHFSRGDILTVLTLQHFGAASPPRSVLLPLMHILALQRHLQPWAVFAESQGGLMFI